jgi:hypothetical protein
MLRKIVLIPAALTTAFAAINIFFGITASDIVPARLIIQVLSAAFIFAAALLAWAFAFRPALSKNLGTWMSLAGVGLIATGLVGGWMAYAIGSRTGDFEYYLFLADGLLIGQGGLHLLAAWWRADALGV